MAGTTPWFETDTPIFENFVNKLENQLLYLMLRGVVYWFDMVCQLL